MTPGRPGGGNTTDRAILAARTRERMIELIGEGTALKDCRAILGVTVQQYEKWRSRFPEWRVALDQARSTVPFTVADWQGDDASFVRHYFGMDPADFQIDWMQTVDTLRAGDIAMSLWPPEHGKTTTAENRFNRQLAERPDFRITVGSEAQKLAKKIVNRVRNRMEPDGPTRQYVHDWGPFVPQYGIGRKPNQPWGDEQFNVYKKNTHDERDYSMQAIGRDSSVLSTRCDHLHIDDVQSVKTLGITDKLIDIIRQDWFSRPGESGITTIAGSPVGDRDVYSELEDDEELVGILHVKKYPAIVVDAITGEERPLLPQKYTLENLDRIKRKATQEKWERNYMMNREGAKGMRTFDDEAIENAKDYSMSLVDHHPPERSAVYITVDPALGGWNCVMALEVRKATVDGVDRHQLVVREIREVNHLRTNEQIMEQLGMTLMRMRGFSCNVTDVVIEEMNFQKGLVNDERLKAKQKEYGFALRGHLTGWNKYDPDIGVPSMVTDLRAGDLILPYASDDVTRREVDELIRQMKRWKQGLRGNKVRMDRLMALWFGWILWQNRYKRPTEQQEAEKWKRQGLPFKRTDVGLIVPMNYKVSA